MDEKERLKKHLEYLCSFDKLTGEPEALLAVNYLIQTLKEDGISCHTEKFDAYLSNPIHSHLVIDGEEIPSRPRSFSESTSKPLHVPVIYDHGTREAVSLVEQKAFLETVSGKLVLGYGYDERYAKLLEQYGAAGWVQIWTSGETQIHEEPGMGNAGYGFFPVPVKDAGVSDIKACGRKNSGEIRAVSAGRENTVCRS